MASNRIGGTLFFIVGNQQKKARGNWIVQPSKYRFDDVVGPTQADCGFTVCPVLPYAKGDFSTVPGESVSDLMSIMGQTVTLLLANGTTYMLTKAWANPMTEVSTSEGKYTVEIKCLDCFEVPSD